MGNIKPASIKMHGDKIFAEQKNRLSKDFKENKRMVHEMFECSKYTRNKLAGYLTRKMNTKPQTKRYLEKKFDKKRDRDRDRGRGRDRGDKPFRPFKPF